MGSNPVSRTTSEKLGGVPGLRPVYRPEFFFLFRVDPLRWVRRGFLFRWCTGAFIGSETNAVFRCRKGGAAERFSFGAYAEAVERSLCRRRPSFSSFQNSNHFGCFQIRKHRRAREKRYSFGYAVSFIPA